MTAPLDLILKCIDKFEHRQAGDLVARADDFKESDHPRDKGGQFSSGGGGGMSPAEKSGGPLYRFAGQPKDPPAVGKRSTSGEQNGGYGSAGTTKNGVRVQHAWEKEGRPELGDRNIEWDPVKVARWQAQTSGAAGAKAATPVAGVKTAPASPAAKSAPTPPLASSSKAAPATSAPGGQSKAPFVNEFMKGHTNREEDLSRLSGMSDEKLNKALELLKKHNVNDEGAKYMKELIRDTLKFSK